MMIRIVNKHKIKCSIDGCDSIYIARKRDWICFKHLQIEYNNKTIQGQKNYFKGKQKPIKKVSKSMEAKLKIYSSLKKEFMSISENKYCPVFKNKPATEVHHKKTRIGSLLLETKYWLAVSSEGHRYIHENDSWSRRKGYLLSKFS